MLLNELFQPPISGLQDIKDDDSKPKWHHSRKTKLTLGQIRKLRRMNDVRNFEQAEYLRKVRAMYGASADHGQAPGEIPGI